MIPKTMKACLLTAANTFEIREIPVPRPEAGEVLCRIRAAAICGTDPEIVDGTHLAKGWPPQYPFILGHEWSGEVVEAGPGVTEFKIGDRVAGEAHKGCGICGNCTRGNYTLCLNYGKIEKGHRHYGFTVAGANCEYNAYSVKSIHKIPTVSVFPMPVWWTRRAWPFMESNSSASPRGGRSRSMGPGRSDSAPCKLSAAWEPERR